MRLFYASRNFAVMRSPLSPEVPELLTVTQAAEELHIAPRTLHHRILTGKVAATKIGDGKTSAYVITRAEVTRLLGEPAA